MGCGYSYEAEDNLESAYAPRPVGPAYNRPTNYPSNFKPPAGALYGEYKCGCGNFWVSRLSWHGKYQQCKRCKARVRPRCQRELRPSDFSRDNIEGKEHPKELCEMCRQLGHYCGNYK